MMNSKNEKLKVMLASRPKMLSDVIRNMVEHQTDMEVVAEVMDPIELLNATRKIFVDVVIITPIKIHGKPKLCTHLLNEHPSLKIVVLSADGESGHLYQTDVADVFIEKPSESAIMNAIRESLA